MAYKDLVQQLYVGYYGRPADKEGLDFWNDKLEEAEGDFNAIMDEFIDPTEYQVPMDGDDVDYEALVNWFYNNLFGRDAEEDGLNFYVDGLESGDFTVEDVGKRIMDGAQNGDVDTMANRVAFANYVTEAVELYEFTDDEYQQLLVLLYAVDADTDLDAAIDEFNDWLDDFEPPAPPPPTEGKIIWLTPEWDVETGTADADTFMAPVVQNMFGAESNTLGTGDRLYGEGGNDTLKAELIAGRDLGGRETWIRPVTESVEDMFFTSLLSYQDFGGAIPRQQGTVVTDTVQYGVTIDAANINGANQLWSYKSNADLTITNVTTLDGDIARNTEEVAIGMAFTGNRDSGWEESSYYVYFDQKYLIAGVDPGQNMIYYELLDQDAYDKNEDFLSGVILTTLDFTLDDVDYELTPEDPMTATGADITTHEEMVAYLNTLLEDYPELAGLEFRIEGTFTDPNGRVAPTIVLEAPGELGDLTIPNPNIPTTAAVLTPTTSDNRYDQVRLIPATVTPEDITATIFLHAVGNGSDGGELVVGGMSKTGCNEWDAGSGSKGIPVFDITVLGWAEGAPWNESSSLSSLRSTNNTLEEVYITTGAAYANDPDKAPANLTIGNSNTCGWDSGSDRWEWIAGSLGQADFGSNAYEVYEEIDQADLVEQLNGCGDKEEDCCHLPLKDVQLLDATKFQGNLSAFAELTRESVDKYLNLEDFQANPAADNVQFSYLGGSGNDLIALRVNASLSQREDFKLLMDGGSGDDTLILHLALNSNAQYYNQSTVQAQHESIQIKDMSGNNTVWTPGMGDVMITTGGGDDTIYTDNTGNNARWVFNSSNQGTPYQGIALEAHPLYKSTLTVTFSGASTGGGVTSDDAAAFANGFESTVTIPTTLVGGFYGDQRHINQAMKNAINNDPVLNKLLVAFDGPNNTLVVRTLIDGNFANDDLEITINSPTWGSLSSTVEQNNLLTAYQDFMNDSTLTNTDLWTGTAAGDTIIPINNLLIGDILDTNYNQLRPLSGSVSYEQSDNIINAGGGNDVIVLGTADSSDAFNSSNDTIVFTGDSIGHNTIVNFVQSGSVGSGIYGTDYLDFTFYLTNMVSATGSIESQVLVPTNYVAQGGVAGANSVTILEFDAGTGTNANQTWANLLGTNLTAALNGTTIYGGTDPLNDAKLDAFNDSAQAPNDDLVGNTLHHIVLVENYANDGEYKVFKMTSTLVPAADAGDFTSAQLLGVIDFGTSLDTTTLAMDDILI